MRATQLHRYPVKSMLGESLGQVQVGANGFIGDRSWAVREATSTLSGKKHPALMSATARLSQEPSDESQSAPVTIELPDGTVVHSADANAASTLGSWLNEEVTLWPLVSADNIEFFRREATGDATPEQMEAGLRQVFARLPDEPMPDIASFPPELFEFETPPGTYFDAFPILLVSTAAIDTLTSRADSNFDLRRFRPNIVIDGMTGEFPENELVGKQCQIGDVVLSIEMPCPRCIMTTHPISDLPKDPKVMRALVQNNNGDLGVYARIVRGGTIRTGDTIEVLDQPLDTPSGTPS